MLRDLDVGPLRSFVAVADCGGFQRAANALHLSQGAVSQHVRRLEAAVGRPLVERQGRGSRFTPDGDKLLRQARLERGAILREVASAVNISVSHLSTVERGGVQPGLVV